MCIGTTLALISACMLGFFAYKAFKKYIAPHFKKIISFNLKLLN